MKSDKKANIYSAEFRESAVKLAIESDQPKIKQRLFCKFVITPSKAC
ncbi:MAG TPA: hypothetical protein QF900_08995 [Arenicellales bacterium]|jgi:hypothetical protein|nr:hypothetical protein [Arenicellales bacterium]